MSYDTLAHIIKLGGTVAFFSVFMLAILYALWPKNKAKFEKASHIPLGNIEAPDV